MCPEFFGRPSAIDTANTSSASGCISSDCTKSTTDSNLGTAYFSSMNGAQLYDTEHCIVCKRKLAADDKAITMKLISRTVTEFYCIDCLGEKLGCGRAPIEKRIRYYRESGSCTLFR